jgi:hypothetical protein
MINRTPLLAFAKCSQVDTPLIVCATSVASSPGGMRKYD